MSAPDELRRANEMAERRMATAARRKANESLVTAARLRELLVFVPETGEFFWRVNRGGAARAGMAAGHMRRQYRYIRLGDRDYPVYRLAFLWMTGEWPRDVVDHMDHNPQNNAWSNLRECSHSQNNANRRTPSHNTSGCRGVSLVRSTGKWRAAIGIAGKLRRLGDFTDKYAAARAYDRAAADEYGEFAVLNNLPHPQFKFDEIMGAVQFLSAPPRAIPPISEQANDCR